MPIIIATDTEFIMRPDYLSIVPSNTRGRDSNRISSYSKYRDSVVILDVQHVPDSICSVWPAFWTVTAGKWPEGGEIDIYEGKIPLFLVCNCQQLLSGLA